ncbi:hypothetical protein [Hahella sp. CCB-MM4]|uniref:hypothetical protein n=1 Tax=Hahella sp. (strain CCB-MM4) TaxID=1926491 RepID=UPI001AEFAF10|nr:hypothetical protein [Hahella sp. CCB-MM4]
MPFAWPLTEKDEYTSVGVNFGDINIEFISFRVRFGIKDTKFKGFSGIAFKVVDSLEESIKSLKESELSYRVGEECEAHTTLSIEESQIFPTVFLVKYHFETSGWVERLKKEFIECSGGNYHIARFKSLSVSNRIPNNLKNNFRINFGVKNQVCFESSNGERAVISDLIENLEIVITPKN